MSSKDLTGMIREYLQDWFSFPFKVRSSAGFELVDLLSIVLEAFSADTLILIRNKQKISLKWYLRQLNTIFKSAENCI